MKKQIFPLFFLASIIYANFINCMLYEQYDMFSDSPDNKYQILSIKKSQSKNHSKTVDQLENIQDILTSIKLKRLKNKLENLDKYIKKRRCQKIHQSLATAIEELDNTLTKEFRKYGYIRENIIHKSIKQFHKTSKPFCDLLDKRNEIRQKRRKTIENAGDLADIIVIGYWISDFFGIFRTKKPWEKI